MRLPTLTNLIISQPPSSKTNLVGSGVTFNVLAAGTGDLSYHWKRNGTNLIDGPGLSGASSDSLTISNVTLFDSADYVAIVVSPYGSATSSSARLTVIVPPPIVAGGPAIDNGQFVVRFQGVSGLAYTVQYATTLSPPDWKKLAMFTAPSVDQGLGIGVFEVRDAIVTGAERYYRTVFPEE